MAFKAVILRLKPEQLYDVASGVRGPDVDDSPVAANIKSLTTAVIRYFAFTNPDDVGGVVNSPAEAQREWELMDNRTRKAVKKFAQAGKNYHYMRHTRDALRALPQREVKKYIDWLETIGVI